MPRPSGPIDMRWDGAVYYILGTSFAEGRGYRLLNEPGVIEAVQYPPLLPAIVAAHQLVAGTNDPSIVGRWLRWSSFLAFLAFAAVVLRFLRSYLPFHGAMLGTLLSLGCLHAWFLSDLLFPEIWFSIATLGFLIFARRPDRPLHTVMAYVCAVSAYFLRTVGLAAFAVWVLESLLRRRFRQAVARGLLAAVPVSGWQFYVASVERSYEYKHPAYEYQRAPYLFYNVSYPRNIALRDPFTPEKGEVRIIRRVVRNALEVPLHIGETLSTSRGYFQMALGRLFGRGERRDFIVRWSVFIALSILGGVLVSGGLALQLARGQLVVPLYVLLYIAALCLTPFPGQYLRYLMPIAPLLVLCAIVFLQALGAPRRKGNPLAWPPRWLALAVLGPGLLSQTAAVAVVYGQQYQPVAYVDAKGSTVVHKLFFYGPAEREFNVAIDYIRTQATRSDVVAAGTPHWIYLRTGLKTVMPPFEKDVAAAQTLLDTVPVRYLIIGEDVVATERYTAPVVTQFPDRWEHVYSTPGELWRVYRRTRP